FGAITAGQWEHLAVVRTAGRLILFRNGKKVAESNFSSSVHDNFSIGGVDGHNKESFVGEIASVRLSTFDDKSLDLGAILLLDRQKMAEVQAKQQAETRTRLETILKTNGVVRAESFESKLQEKDWMIHKVAAPVQVLGIANEESQFVEVVLENGIVSRSFLIKDNLACVSYRNHRNNLEYIRSIQPEARIQIDGTWYTIGGLKGQTINAYLMRSWYDQLSDDGLGFTFSSLEVGTPKKRYHWKQRYNADPSAWPPQGMRLTMTYQAPKGAKVKHQNLVIKVHYELYQGAPVLCKYVTVHNSAEHEVIINRIETESIALQQDVLRLIHQESDYSCALINREEKASDTQHLIGGLIKGLGEQGSTTKWRRQTGYFFYATHNQAEDQRLQYPLENLLVSTYPFGPDAPVAANSEYCSMHTFQLLHDSDETERRSLGHRRMYRLIAPQVTEKLLNAFISDFSYESCTKYIDQMAELGFESLDLQWPNRVDHDNNNAEYMAKFKAITDYATSKGIEVVGAYELSVASRDRGAANNVVHPDTGKPGGFFGQSLCVGTQWWDDYRGRVETFFDTTGFKQWSIDGPYHGEPCASTAHKHHRGLNDSFYVQHRIFEDMLHELLRRDIFIPIPDWYFLNGQSVTSMGYREAAANLSATLQLLLYRQYIYDGTWFKTPTMGWIEFTVAKLKPYQDNLAEYERWLVQGLGSGTHINWRGGGLFYDSPESKKMVKGWIDWYKRHREVLSGDIIHLSRPSGRDVDAIFHVNPFGREKGMAVVFNPLQVAVKRSLKLPLFYTGLENSKTATVLVGHSYQEAGQAIETAVEADGSIRIPVEIPAEGQVWILITP
ncbi:MAG: LamG domain-containing protein, partial [Planctomycetes bacterium]|nr:LamG domain-containing protein [Planctomycetota bacterium]